MAPNLSEEVAATGLLLSLGYFVVAWLYIRCTRPDPVAGVQVSQPPGNLSAAAVRFVSRMGFDDKMLAVALIEMSSRGSLSIREAGGVFTVTRSRSDDHLSLVPPDERKLEEALFEGRESLAFTQKHHTQVSGATEALRGALRAAHEGVDFINNDAVFVAGLGLLVLTALVTVVVAHGPFRLVIVTLSAPLFAVAVAAIAAQHRTFVRFWRNRRDIWLALASAGLLVFVIFGPDTPETLRPALWLLSLQSVVAAVFRSLLKTATDRGARLMAQIDAFRKHLITLADKSADASTAALLAYAVALDLEPLWQAPAAAWLRDARFPEGISLEVVVDKLAQATGDAKFARATNRS